MVLLWPMYWDMFNATRISSGQKPNPICNSLTDSTVTYGKVKSWVDFDDQYGSVPLLWQTKEIHDKYIDSWLKTQRRHHGQPTRAATVPNSYSCKVWFAIQSYRRTIYSILNNMRRNYTSDDSHDEWVRDCWLDVKRLLVQGLQFLVILLCSVHLDLQCVDL